MEGFVKSSKGNHKFRLNNEVGLGKTDLNYVRDLCTTLHNLQLINIISLLANTARCIATA